MNGLNKVVMIASKIIEILLIILSGLCIAGCIGIGYVDEVNIQNWINASSGNLNLNNVSMSLINNPKYTIMISLIIVAAILICAALILRNIYLIFKITIQKKSPFQSVNVKRIKNNAYIMIGIIVLELVGSIIVNSIAGIEIAKCTIDLGQLFFVLIVLCLSQFFAYGQSLEEEVEGLV